MNEKGDNKLNRERRVNFILSNQEHDLLKNIQSRTNQTISDLVRDALKIYDWTKDGGTDEDEFKELAKNAIKIYLWTQKQAEKHGLDASPVELIKNSIKVFLWAREEMQKGNSQLDPREIQILFQ